MVRGVAVEPLFVVLALCWLTSNSGQARARIAQRYAFLFRVEDNAAVWVSYAAALLRNGHIPPERAPSPSISGTPRFPPLGSAHANGAARSPHGQTSPLYTKVDVTMASQLLAVVVAAGLIVLAFIVSLVNVDGERRPPVAGTMLLAVVLT